jgi:RNA-directed DNA polymerase
LAHAYAQCRSNKGAPGVDGQDFADIEAYGVERSTVSWVCCV